MCQNDWLLTGLFTHLRYIHRCIGYVTEAELFDMPKDFCLAEDVNAARQGAGCRLASQGVCSAERDKLLSGTWSQGHAWAVRQPGVCSGNVDLPDLKVVETTTGAEQERETQTQAFPKFIA